MKEDKYREALQDRTIEPSSGSWDKLSSQLEAQEAQSKNRYWRKNLGIACVFRRAL